MSTRIQVTPTLTKQMKDKPILKDDYLSVPYGLDTPRQLEIWNDIVLSMQPGYYKDCDTSLIVQYIKIQHISEVLMKELMEEETATVSDSGVVMVNKKIAAIDKLAGTSATLAQKLGFAPSTRNRADIKDPSKKHIPSSELDSILD